MAKIDRDQLLSRAKGLLPEDKLRSLADRFDVDVMLQAAAEKVFSSPPPALAEGVMNDATLRDALIDLKLDVEATLRAIEIEDDPVKVAQLQADLVESLPARQAAIDSRAATLKSREAQEALKEGLTVLVQLVKAVAQAFVAR